MKNVRAMMAAVVAGGLLLAGCGSSGGAASSDKVYEIGIAQIVSHPSLDAVREGVVQALADAGYEDGKNINLDVQNPQGDQSALTNIANSFASKDAVVAIATPTAQAMAQAVTDKPIVFSAVTDPVSSQLVDSWEEPGGNITGTSDINPIEEQFDLITEIVPNAKTVGIVYSSAEQNSEIQVELAEGAAEKRGLEIKTATVTNSSEIQQATRSLDVDAFFVPTDNTVVSGLEGLLQVAEQTKTPVISADSDSVTRGVIASVAVDYAKMGTQTGEMLVRILEGADPATMAVETQKEPQLTINPKAAARIGITLPADLVSRADKIVE